MCGFVFAGAATGDNVTAVISAVLLPGGRRIAEISSYTGRRKKAAKPIARLNNGDGRKKMAAQKKPWMMKVQHLPLPMLSCLQNS
jgi:hypothetical protein